MNRFKKSVTWQSRKKYLQILLFVRLQKASLLIVTLFYFHGNARLLVSHSRNKKWLSLRSVLPFDVFIEACNQRKNILYSNTWLSLVDTRSVLLV